MHIETLFEELFYFLELEDYHWKPTIPEEISKYRREHNRFSSLEKMLGLGLTLDSKERQALPLPYKIISEIESLRLGVSRVGNYFIPFSHWPCPAERPDEYVHLGKESTLFLIHLYRHWEKLKDKRILDLGCGGGVLSFQFQGIADFILGVDRSHRAVSWAKAAAQTQKCDHTQFIPFEISQSQDNKILPTEIMESRWDIAVFNPPLAISKVNSYFPHRDGGLLGLEIPLLFLDFCENILIPKGEVFCLMSNPIRYGKGVLFESLVDRKWKIMDSVCINPHFNHQLAHEDEYDQLGIQKIELRFLHLKKLN